MASEHRGATWQTSGSVTYSPETFYTKSTDDKGKQKHIRVNVPANIGRQIDSMIQQRKVPAYETRQDFMRDAAVHRLRWLHDNDIVDDPRLDKALKIAETESVLIGIQENIENQRRSLEQFRQVMRVATAEDDRQALEEAVYEVEQSLRNMDQPWYGRMLQEIERAKAELRVMSGA